MTSKEFGKILQDKLTSEYGVELNVASNQQIYRSLALICRQMMSENHKKFQSKAIGTGTKQVYYLCMEFLMGRSLKMSLFNLGLDEVAKKALADADINLDSIFEEEPDAGLGNGGLGRLAACYLDGMATTDICGTGYSILYEYGIFKQKIVDGWQQERADNWLPGGQVWIKIFPDKPVTQKPAETRMGSGKGSPEYWVAVVKPGRVMFEIAGVPEDVAREALRLASHKLPIKTKIVKREDLEAQEVGE